MSATFKEWLERTLERQQVSRRELARRLATRHPGDYEEAVETHRRSVRRILAGRTRPSNKTREAIQDALGDHTAPSVEDERQAADEERHDTAEALVRDPEFLDALLSLARRIPTGGKR